MDIEKHRNIRKRPIKIEPFQGPTPIDIPRRRQPIKNPNPGASKDRVHEIFKNRSDIEITTKTGFRSGPLSRRQGYRLAAWSWLAATIDALILISLSCVFLLLFAQLAKQLHLSGSTIKSFTMIYGLCLWVYMVSLRVFAGHTIGEWTCDLRLGQPHERMQTSYPFRVILRVCLVMMTGIVFFPLLALLFRKDIAGQLTGVKLFSLK